MYRKKDWNVHTLREIVNKTPALCAPHLMDGCISYCGLNLYCINKVENPEFKRCSHLWREPGCSEPIWKSKPNWKSLLSSHHPSCNKGELSLYAQDAISERESQQGWAWGKEWTIQVWCAEEHDTKCACKLEKGGGSYTWDTMGTPVAPEPRNDKKPPEASWSSRKRSSGTRKAPWAAVIRNPTNKADINMYPTLVISTTTTESTPMMTRISRSLKVLPNATKGSVRTR